MEAQVDQQKPDIPQPAALHVITVAIVASIVVLIALPVVMAIDSDTTYATIRRNRPDLDSSQLDIAFYVVLADAAFWHLIDVVLTVWFGLKIRKGRNWARIALSVYLVIATFASLYSAASGSEYYWAVISSDVLHVALLILLWAPKSMREFFTAHREAAATSRNETKTQPCRN